MVLDSQIAEMRRRIATIEDIRAAEEKGFPDNLPATTFELFKERARSTPALPALSFFAAADRHQQLQSWTYGEMFEAINGARALFESLGVGSEDVVALILPNLPQTHFALWGAEAAGIAFPINPMLDAGSIRGLLRNARATVVVTTSPEPGPSLFEKVAAAAIDADTVRHVVLIDPVDRDDRGAVDVPPPHEGVRFVRFDPDPTGQGSPVKTIGDGDRIASLFCTGGTTGLPKIARRTHRNEIANAWMIASAQAGAIGPGATFFCGLPLFHVNGAMVTGLAPFLAGAHVLLGTAQGYRAPGLVGNFWDIVEHHKVSAFSGVPTLFASLLEIPTHDRDLSSLRFAVCGAAPLPSALHRTFEELTGVPLMEGYGLTEATCASTCNPIDGERRVGSVGLPLPFQRLAIGSTEGAAFAKTGATGRVLLAGRNVFSGYVDGRHENGIWVEIAGERWLDTGDLGSIDAEGYLWLTGRAKDIIIRGGHNIDPSVIEEALAEHPAVALAAAIGRPDARLGEVPVAYVQLRQGAHVDGGELVAFAAARIGERAAWPKSVAVEAELPLTSVGKIHKPSLRLLETKAVVNGLLEQAKVVPLKADFEFGAGNLPCVRLLVATPMQAEAVSTALSTFAIEAHVQACSLPSKP